MSLKARIWAFGLEIEPQGLDFSLKYGILALSLRFESQGWILRLKAQIWASKAVKAASQMEILKMLS